MIQIITTAKDTMEFVRKAKVNIQRSQTKLARRMGEFGLAELRFRAPFWRGNIQKGIALKVFPASHKAELLMATSRLNEIALENEYNISGRRKIYKSQYPLLGQWAEEKGVFQNRPYVIVGGRNTRLGKQNVFFYPSFLEMNRAVPDVAREVISKAIMRTRG